MTEFLQIALRPLGVADVDAVLRIRAQCYGAGFVEPREVFARRLAGAGHCSWAAVRGDEVMAYLAAYWSRPGAVTPLNGDFAEYADASVLYLHDMAVSPSAAGRGLASSLVRAVREQARARGITFRGVGNERGWLVEVGAGETPALHVELDYGERKIDLAHVQRLSGAPGYTGTTSDGVEVGLQLQHGDCSDGMSDQTYPVSAKLSVGDKTYAGCGRFLQE